MNTKSDLADNIIDLFLRKDIRTLMICRSLILNFLRTENHSSQCGCLYIGCAPHCIFNNLGTIIVQIEFLIESLRYEVTIL